MKKVMKNVLIILCVCLLYSVNVFAGASGKTGVTVKVNNDSLWHGSTSVSRTKSCQYITLWCQYVIPDKTGVSDNFTMVNVSAKNSSGALIGSKYPDSTSPSSVSLKENATNDTKLYIIDGQLNLSTVYLCYRNDYLWVPIITRVYYKGN